MARIHLRTLLSSLRPRGASTRSPRRKPTPPPVAPVAQDEASKLSSLFQLDFTLDVGSNESLAADFDRALEEKVAGWGTGPGAVGGGERAAGTHAAATGGDRGLAVDALGTLRTATIEPTCLAPITPIIPATSHAFGPCITLHKSGKALLSELDLPALPITPANTTTSHKSGRAAKLHHPRVGSNLRNQLAAAEPRPEPLSFLDTNTDSAAASESDSGFESDTGSNWDDAEWREDFEAQLFFSRPNLGVWRSGGRGAASAGADKATTVEKAPVADEYAVKMAGLVGELGLD